jgi:hypothetical protein
MVTGEGQYSEEDYRRLWVDDVSLDDNLWHQAMVTARYSAENRRGVLEMTSDEVSLWRLIRLCVCDADKEWDRPFDASTRAMRAAGSIADRLWAMYQQEKERVSR